MRRFLNVLPTAALAPVLLIAVIAIDLSFPLRAQAQDVSAQFPAAAQVAADYPDDVQRWGAFNVLHQALYKAAPRPMSKAAYALSFDYENGYNSIINNFIAQGPSGRQAYQNFNAQCDKLFSNQDFDHSVLEKYHLLAYFRAHPVAASPGVAQNAPNAQNPSTVPNAASAATRPSQNNPVATAPTLPPEAIRKLFPQLEPKRTFMDDECPYPQSFPLLLLFLIPVAIATYFATVLATFGARILPTPPPERGGLPALPEALRVVKLPGVRYAVYVLSGMEMQKETKTYTSTTTHTTPGAGGAPPTTTTYTSRIRQETIWVRQPDGREAPWNFDDSNFQSRPGQLLSVLVRPLDANSGDIILVYNHTTGYMEFCPGATKAHGVTGFLRREFVQWTGNIACGIASAIVTVRYIPMFNQGSLYAGFLVWWFVGALILVTLSFLVVTPLVTNRLQKRREAVFKKKYFAGLRQYFEQGNSILQQTFSRI